MNCRRVSYMTEFSCENLYDTKRFCGRIESFRWVFGMASKCFEAQLILWAAE